MIQAIAHLTQKAPTFDEPNWMTIAWYLTHHWSWQMDYHVLMHPPLSFYLHGIPLRVWELWHSSSSQTPPEGILADQFPYPYSALLKYDTVFTIAKLSMVPWAALLGWYIWLWTARFYGKRAAFLALGLYSFNPYMIAYAGIITSDLTVTCFMLIATYHFWRFCQTPSGRNMLLAGITLGLALLSKASAVLLFPIFLVLGSLVWFSRRLRSKSPGKPCAQEGATPNDAFPTVHPHTFRKLLIGMGLIFCISLVVLDAGYLFDRQPVRSFHADQSTDLIYRLFKDIPIPFGAHMNSIRLHQSFISSMTRKQFLAGERSTTTWWYYHLVTFVIKNPLPLSIFLGLLLVIGIKQRKRFRFSRWIRCEAFLILPAGMIFVYFSFFFPLNVSSRFVLPAYPFILIGIGSVLRWSMLKRRSVQIIFGVCVGWYILSSLAIFPDYLAYCNELIGGTEQGYTWFADSSYDWGQDLKGLGQYVQEQDIPLIRLAYFGTAIPEYYGIRYRPLDEPAGCHPTPGIIAISTTKLQGVYEQNQECYRWLTAYEPFAKIGYTIFIYAIENSPGLATQ